MADSANRWPQLRDELEIYEGGIAPDGSPTWTISDPIRNQFFKIDWGFYEVLGRWALANPQKVSESVNGETALNITPEYVQHVVQFLSQNQLTRSQGRNELSEFSHRVNNAKQPWWIWLMHHYLFFRIPLVRPIRFLTWAYPYIKWLFSVKIKIGLILGLVLGVFLVTRQWDVFNTSLVDVLNLQGLIYFILSLVIAKIAHEFGHAFTAVRYGCNVPSMGIAFLVMWPMLYTDCNETWKLKDRHQRLSVGAAGMMVEFSIAIVATLIWSFAPHGPMKDIALILATTTWVSSVLINFSPFMRFDGYYLLSDFLDFPNLHERAFALSRWKLREVLFNLGAEPPEKHSLRMRFFLIAFGISVWIYRLILFIGIAILVYHFFIKVVGILLFLIEIIWFVLRPIWFELKQWHHRKNAILAQHRLRWSAGFFATVMALFFIPWQTTLSAPSVIKARDLLHMYALADGQLVSRLPENGVILEKGDVIAQFQNPEFTHKRDQLVARKQSLEYELKASSFDRRFRERSDVILADLAKIDTELYALDQDVNSLVVRAPYHGRFIDPEIELNKGQWVSNGQRLGALRATEQVSAIAYVGEEDVFRIHTNAPCRFFVREPGGISFPCNVELVELTAATHLAEPMFAKAFGGDISVRASEHGMVPETAQYMLRLNVSQNGPILKRKLIGDVVIDANSASTMRRAWNFAVSVLIRESGF